MEPSRELDAEIARKIMGIEVHQAKEGDVIFTVHRDFVDSGDYWYHRPSWGDDEIPHYSTDIAAAWVAADHFAEQYGCAVRVERIIAAMAARTKKRYSASVQGGELAYERFDCTVYAASDEGPAHALCLALMAAGEVEQ